MKLIQIWTETTHSFIQVVKLINILLILLHTLGGSYVYDPIFVLITKMKELSTTLFHI